MSLKEPDGTIVLESTEMPDQNTNSPVNETLKSDLNSSLYVLLMLSISVYRITNKTCSTVRFF